MVRTGDWLMTLLLSTSRVLTSDWLLDNVSKWLKSVTWEISLNTLLASNNSRIIKLDKSHYDASIKLWILLQYLTILFTVIIVCLHEIHVLKSTSGPIMKIIIINNYNYQFSTVFEDDRHSMFIITNTVHIWGRTVIEYLNIKINM